MLSATSQYRIAAYELRITYRSSWSLFWHRDIVVMGRTAQIRNEAHEAGA